MGVYYELRDETRNKRIIVLPSYEAIMGYYQDSIRHRNGHLYSVYKLEGQEKVLLHSKELDKGDN